jgi:hypothetical protein
MSGTMLNRPMIEALAFGFSGSFGYYRFQTIIENMIHPIPHMYIGGQARYHPLMPLHR